MRVPVLSRRQVTAAASALAAMPAGLHACSPAGSIADLLVVDLKAAGLNAGTGTTEPVGSYSTITAALAVAPKGATVLVRPGLYRERVFLKSEVSILADRGAVLDWKSDRPYEAALTVDLSVAAAPCRVLVQGLEIRHSSPSIAQNYAVYVPAASAAADGESRIELCECQISSTSGSGVGVEGGDVTLSSCRIADCNNHGALFLGPTARGAMRDCLVERNKLNGVLLRDGAYPTLERNQWVANGQFGLKLVNCRSRQYDANVASKNGKGSVDGECDDFDE